MLTNVLSAHKPQKNLFISIHKVRMYLSTESRCAFYRTLRIVQEESSVICQALRLEFWAIRSPSALYFAVRPLQSLHYTFLRCIFQAAEGANLKYSKAVLSLFKSQIHAQGSCVLFIFSMKQIFRFIHMVLCFIQFFHVSWIWVKRRFQQSTVREKDHSLINLFGEVIFIKLKNKVKLNFLISHVVMSF